jgi:hypothetical protein
MVVLDVTAPTSVPVRFAAGVVAGLAATLTMDLVMARLPEGRTVPAIPSGVLTELPPQDAPERLATVIHYLAGTLTGPLFVWLLFATEAVLGGPSPLGTAAAGVVLYGLMVGFFAVVVLPQSLVFEGRVATIRRDWAVCALAYVLVLVPLVAAVSRVL